MAQLPSSFGSLRKWLQDGFPSMQDGLVAEGDYRVECGGGGFEKLDELVSLRTAG